MLAAIFKTPKQRFTIWAIYVALIVLGVLTHSAELVVRQERGEFRPDADTVVIGMARHALGTAIAGTIGAVLIWFCLRFHHKSVSLFAFDRDRILTNAVASSACLAILFFIAKGIFAADRGIWFVVPFELGQMWFVMVLRASISAEREMR